MATTKSIGALTFIPLWALNYPPRICVVCLLWGQLVTGEPDDCRPNGLIVRLSAYVIEDVSLRIVVILTVR